MTFDFTTVIDRHGKDALAVDNVEFMTKNLKEGFDFIPLWVADMNFETAPSITRELEKRISHALYGYFELPEEYYNAIISWHQDTPGFEDVTKDMISYENGVLGGVVSALRVVAHPGDNVLLHSPTYIGFTHALHDTGYHIIHSPLVKDENGVWRMDYEDMDRKIKENHIHVAIFCNPHNPTGRVWSKEEIQKALEVYEANDVFVIVDQIWADLLINGNKYTPVHSVSHWAKEHTANYFAPSKTFNLAGLVGSYSIIYNKTFREKERECARKAIYNHANVLSVHALIGAYSQEGKKWKDALLEVLSHNVNYVVDYVHEHFQGVEVFRSEGTYMLFLDCNAWLKQHHMSAKELIERGWSYGIGWQDGTMFEAEGCIRLNVASPTSRIEEACHRMNTYVFNK